MAEGPSKWNIHRLNHTTNKPNSRVSTTIIGTPEEADELARRLTDSSQDRVFVARKAKEKN